MSYHQPPEHYRPPTFCERCLGHIVLVPVVGGYGWRHLTQPPAGHEVVMRAAGWFDPQTGRTEHGITVTS